MSLWPGGSATGQDAPALTPAQWAGQRVVFAYPGSQPPRALVRRVQRGQAAGVVLFARNITSPRGLRTTVRQLQRAAGRSPVPLPLLVMVDQEGGLVKRLPGGPGRSAAEVGATGSRRAALHDGRSAGLALRAAGANVDLAPVADVCRAGAALDRERRCYARRPARVTRLAGAFAAGLRSRGVAATLKHFPGFGAARVNTDLSPVVIRTPRRRLRRIDERPFAALADRAQLVMLSTAVYPAFDRLPAVFSRALSTRELRGRLGFAGVSVSDALDTPAVASFGGPGRLALRAARAGTDIVLYGRGYAAGATAANTLAARLRTGRLRRQPFLRSARRVMALRAALLRGDRRRLRSSR